MHVHEYYNTLYVCPLSRRFLDVYIYTSIRKLGLANTFLSCTTFSEVYTRYFCSERAYSPVIATSRVTVLCMFTFLVTERIKQIYNETITVSSYDRFKVEVSVLTWLR